jgi:hypothetical protein
MTEKTAEQVASVLLSAAAIGAAYVILKTPALRRFVFGLAVTAMSGAVPAWFGRELQHAWVESGGRPR